MRSTNKLFLFALIIFLLFGTVPVVQAFDPGTVQVTPISCNDATVDGVIETSEEADYYSIVLAAGQEFIVDVDTIDKGETFDTLLEIYAAPDTEVPVALNDRSSDDPFDEDPYVMLPVDVGGTFYLRIYDATLSGITGAYTLNLKCADQPTSSEFTWPVEDDALLGATGSDIGSLITINPENAISSLPFLLEVGPIADIEYQFSTHRIFVAVNDDFGSNDNSVSIVAVDENTGVAAETFSLDQQGGTETPTLVALEAAESMLYGVQAYPSSEQFSLVEVTFNANNPTTTFKDVFSFTRPVWSLAYHSVERVIYGVAANGSSSDLVKIYLEPELSVETASLVPIVDEDGQPVNIISLDFSHDNILFGVDVTGNLYEIDNTSGLAKLIGDIDVLAEISGLTFVIGNAADVDPVGTICSSTLTASASASSGTADPKLSRFKLKKNPLHRGIGLFKFEGRQGETVTLNVKSDGIESAEAASEAYSASELMNWWLNKWRGKGRVFLGIRDAIPGIDFRERKKEQIPFGLSATLPADGTYYVMVIRPLLRYNQTDYCLSLTSDLQEDSQAWQTFEVAWPNDESGNDSMTTLDEAEVVETQNFDAVVSTDAATEPDSGTSVANEPAAASDTEVTQPVSEETPVVEPVTETPVVTETAAGDTTVEEPVVETTDEPVAQTTLETDPAADGADAEVVQTDGDDTTVEEPVVETTDEPVAQTTLETDPAADDGGGAESGDDPMEDPLHKG